MRAGIDGIWTASQRRGLIALLAGITLLLTFRLIVDRQTVPDPEPAEGPKAGELQDRIDPNVATVEEIAAIPDVGEKRAEAIVEYRRKYLQEHPGRPVFSDAMDLERVAGIGAVTSEGMEPYLVFPETPPKEGR